MKKFFFILLIAIFICYSKQETEDVREIWNKIKNNPDALKTWLSELGIWDEMLDKIMNSLESQALDYCMEEVGSKFVCKEIIKEMRKYIQEQIP